MSEDNIVYPITGKKDNYLNTIKASFNNSEEKEQLKRMLRKKLDNNKEWNDKMGDKVERLIKTLGTNRKRSVESITKAFIRGNQVKLPDPVRDEIKRKVKRFIMLKLKEKREAARATNSNDSSNI